MSAATVPDDFRHSKTTSPRLERALGIADLARF